MKIALFDDFALGVVRGDRIIDVSAALPADIAAAPGRYRMNLIIERFGELRDAIAGATMGDGRPLSSVRLRAPSPAPSKMVFAIGNYHEGVEGASRPLGMFLKAPSTILDPGGVVELPPDDAIIFHHEAELAVVIGRRCRNVSRQEALSCVFGYTGLIDVSARGMGSGVGFIDKSFETFCPLGPWITLADEIPDPQNLSVKLWENDQPRQDYHTSDMEHQVVNLIAYASRVTTLMPGDVIACGTNHQGLGPMQDGETCTLEVEHVGRLSVTVSDPSKRKWPMAIDSNIGHAVREWRRSGVMNPETAYTRRIA